MLLSQQNRSPSSWIQDGTRFGVVDRMSGPLRKLLGPSKARLKQYIEEAERLLAQSLEGKTMEEEEESIEGLIERMNNNVSVVKRCNDDWASLLKTLKGEAKVAEEEEQGRAADGKEGYVEILLNSGECIGRLNARLKRIQRKLEVERRAPLNPVAVATNQQVAGGLSNGGLQVSLPKLQLQTFDGNLQQWQEFWEIFDAAVHQQQGLPPVAKFSYLKSILKGTAAMAISGVSVNNDNYDVALRLLKERFGRPEKIIELLYSKLQAIPKCSNKFMDIKHTCDSIEKILRQLEAQNEPVNLQKMLVQQLLAKFPDDFLLKLEQSKEPTTPWTMENLRKVIVCQVSIQENVSRFVTNVHGKGRCEHDHVTKVKGYNTVNKHEQLQRSSAEVFSNVSTDASKTNVNNHGYLGNTRNVQVLRPCIFCHNIL